MMPESLLRIRTAGDFTVKGGHRIDQRVINDYEIVCFPAGSRTLYSVSDTDFALLRPSAIVTRPGEPHAYRFDPEHPTRHMFAHFQFDSDVMAARYPLLTGGPASPVIELSVTSLIPQMMKQLFVFLYKQPPRWRMHAEALLLVALEELESALDPAGSDASEEDFPAPLAQALHMMETRLQELIPIEQVALSVGWSHEHFTRVFHRYLGQSPKEWLTRRRVELGAQHLLRRTDTVKQIARSIGFADEYYFHRLFRRHMGMTAVEYRRRYGDPRLRELVPADDGARLYPVNHYYTFHNDVEE
jgi:AraC-like DNA-binding protein